VSQPPRLPRSPLEPRTERARGTAESAVIWLGGAALLFIAWKLAEALLLIFAGVIFAAGLQAGEKLLGRWMKGPYALRLAIVVICVVGGLIGFLAFAGLTLAEQAEQLAETLREQLSRLALLAESFGLSTPGADAMDAVKGALGGQIGNIMSLLGTAAGSLAGAVLVMTLGIYIAADPRLYERGIEWLTPARSRQQVRGTLGVMGNTLRRWVVGRLLSMSIEGTMVFIGLLIIGVPLAGLLALIAALLAFIPTIGAMISGVILVTVAFTVGNVEGFWALGLFLLVQQVEGNILTPQIEKRAVDIAPAVVLGAQLLFGVLFGILGVALADPLVALLKVALVRRDDSEPAAARIDGPPGIV